jgi:putative SOS response-associated peptidase YedK
MCFSYSVNFNAHALQSKLLLEELFLPPSGYFFSAFANPLLPVVMNDGKHNICTYKQWGLIPSWTKDEVQANELRKLAYNAKGETIAEKPMFRNAFKNGRCLVPAAGFFEWREVNKKKYPYYIYPADNSFFLFAGIADRWVNPETGEEVESYSIVTSEANKLLSMIHNVKKRMPLILDDTIIDIWLNGNSTDALELVKPYDDLKMAAHTVGPLASNARVERNISEVQAKYLYAELEQNLLF